MLAKLKAWWRRIAPQWGGGGNRLVDRKPPEPQRFGGGGNR